MGSLKNTDISPTSSAPCPEFIPPPDTSMRATKWGMNGTTATTSWRSSPTGFCAASPSLPISRRNTSGRSADIGKSRRRNGIRSGTSSTPGAGGASTILKGPCGPCGELHWIPSTGPSRIPTASTSPDANPTSCTVSWWNSCRPGNGWWRGSTPNPSSSTPGTD